ncbi:polysaccharide deacetylase family protein [Paenibacillus piri]|uniref:Polysaccharide deacetylase family protein n=2 Tax=Paenibacillus piri TaxID=2547395 RepID=A0A4R5KVS5_9BACL|nr:polysaccharide deacetylase family protein [Paenibacillus piri]
MTTACAGNSSRQLKQQSLPQHGQPPSMERKSGEPPVQITEPAKTPKLSAGRESVQRENRPLSLADLHHKYESTFLFNGPSGQRKAALTFDDVPDTEYTPQLLDILKQYGVRATFFTIGNRAEAHPDIVKRMVDEGHAIGSHSYSHPNLPRVSDAVFQNEILRTEQALAPLIGYKPRLFRPPYGNISEDQIQWMASLNYHIINWNVDSLDWKGLTADQVSANVLGHVKPGAVILQHGAGGEGEDLIGTVQALPKIIESLTHSGIQLVTVPELFNITEGTKSD